MWFRSRRKLKTVFHNLKAVSYTHLEYADRQTLWNAVEKAERGKNAQLAYSFDIALQNEFSLEENIAPVSYTHLDVYKRQQRN